LGVVGKASEAIAVLPAAEEPHQLSSAQQHSRNVSLCSLLFLHTGISHEAKTTIQMLWK